MDQHMEDLDNNVLINKIISPCNENFLVDLEDMVKSGVNLDSRANFLMKTAMEIAVENNNYQLVRWLLFQGADNTSVSDDMQYFPLWNFVKNFNQPSSMDLQMILELDFETMHLWEET